MLDSENHLSRKQLLDGLHWQKEATAVLFGREWLETVILVEGLRFPVLGVSDDCPGGNLAREGMSASKGIQEQPASEPLALVPVVDGQPADQGCRKNLVPRDAVCDLGWEVDALYNGGAQRVVAGKALFFDVVEDPDRGDQPLHLPARPLV